MIWWVRLFYATGWLVILPIVLMGSLFRAKHRSGLMQRLGVWPSELLRQIEALSFNPVWIHAVSVGEANAVAPLVKKLSNAGVGVFLTCSTQTGVEIAQGISSRHSGVVSAYCPLDAPWLVAGLLKRVCPRALLIAETELWPSLILETSVRQIPVILINGRLSERSFRGYSPFRWVFSSILNRFYRVMVQTSEDAQRMMALGANPDRVVVMGNLKLDVEPAARASLYRAWQQWLSAKEGPVITLASTHPGEERLLLDAVLPLFGQYPNLKVVLAPRHPERANDVAGLLEARSMSYLKRSSLSVTAPEAVPSSLILLDGVGELTTVYRLSTLAVMGGSWLDLKHGRGGQSPIEPIAAGCAVVFGADMRNFKAIVADIRLHQAGLQVTSSDALSDILRQLLEQPDLRVAMVERGQNWIQQNQGACDRVIKVLSDYGIGQ
ncbi:MAG: 3-deoxy-D-manno-octulosonic acid transferase [Vampirovibrionales bacterium]|nr:3-deoxy-D-manno-octulosonic acid transferase [Vampirovibrionales bacterium]